MTDGYPVAVRLTLPHQADLTEILNRERRAEAAVAANPAFAEPVRSLAERRLAKVDELLKAIHPVFDGKPQRAGGPACCPHCGTPGQLLAASFWEARCDEQPLTVTLKEYQCEKCGRSTWV